MSIIGIDLGTTNSLVSVWKDGKSVLIPNSYGSFLTPSAISMGEDSEVLIGQPAKERLITYPNASIRSFKMLMGTKKYTILNKKAFLPEELSALLLKQLKNDAERFLSEEVTEAVISVPAYFNDRQRNATKRAGELAGLKVERIINEPSAASLFCRMSSTKEEETFLVFDFGGGTLDISLVDCFDTVVNIIAVSGDNHLGGDDFNNIISDYFCTKNGIDFNSLSLSNQAMLKKQAEMVKIALSTQESALMLVTFEEDKTYSLTFTNKLLIQISMGILDKFQKLIKDVLTTAQYNINIVDDIILVGGSCKMPVVKEYLSYILNRKVEQKGSPELMVALGLGNYVGIKERNEDIKDVVLTDICPFSLGIDVNNDSDPNNLYMYSMIERNTSLPCSRQEEFYTACDNQTVISIGIYQGENIYVKNNIQLGEILINIPPAPKGEQSVIARFTYDINGILMVDVESVTSGEKKSSVIVDEENKFTPEEIDKRIKKLNNLKIIPTELAENRLLIERAERIYLEVNGDMRKDVYNYINWFNSVLSTQDSIKIGKARKRMCAFLDMADNYINNFDPFISNDEIYDIDEE